MQLKLRRDINFFLILLDAFVQVRVVDRCRLCLLHLDPQGDLFLEGHPVRITLVDFCWSVIGGMHKAVFEMRYQLASTVVSNWRASTAVPL
jgi:hypothetical protein